ncbi:MAG: hypothetical protein IPL53_17720 [Ignavibacteria bacterium]|nr:hypothetical protein [Ignavibacteria bacterium]
MAKVPVKTQQKKGQSNDTAKYILIAVIVIIAGYFIYTSLFKKEEVRSNNVVIDPKERIKNIKEPVFKKRRRTGILKKEQERHDQKN